MRKLNETLKNENTKRSKWMDDDFIVCSCVTYLLGHMHIKFLFFDII